MPAPLRQIHTETALRDAFEAWSDAELAAHPGLEWNRANQETWGCTARPAVLLRRFTSKGGFTDIAKGTTVLCGNYADERFNEEGYLTMWTIGSKIKSMVAVDAVRFL